MTELTEYAVEDVIKLVRRPIRPAAGETYREIGVRSFGKGIFHKDPVAAEAIAGKKVFRIQPGDLIFSNVFAWEGAVAIASEQERGMIGSHRFMTHQVNVKVADARYLLHYFYGGPGLNVVRSASPGSAGRNRTLGARTFATKQIHLPSVTEQRRIADKLDAAMGSIARVVQLKKESDALVQQHADSLLRSVDQVATLGSALRVDQDFVNVSSDEKYAVTGIYSFGKGLIKRPVIQGSETAYPRFARLRKGQVVMSKLNAWEGALAVVEESFSGTYVSPEYPVFSLNTETADPEYIGHLLAWPELWSRLTPRGSMVRRKRTTPATLLATEVPLPSLPEQRRIAERLTLARRVAEASARQVADLEVLRKGLLDAAFSGRL
ncbi:restriction endonuclease subunit S [Streptomyces sp. NPDC012751]|uniref:restriction endonuclease subunit S n=1 Tax=Streptomyces sp. NPDC012751 TaxID=3364846 RepID=UPI00367D7C5A